MKIGILTFHREINDGSVLQAYCLYRLLNKYFPKDQVELIDYLPDYIRKKRRYFRLSKKKPFFKFDKAKLTKKVALDNFYKSNINLSKQISGSDDVKTAQQALEQLEYDAIFVGSDTVWDTRPNSGAPPVPNIFFLADLTSIKKIAFAASMDKGGPHFVTDAAWTQLLGHINKFNYISVRDHATLKYLKEGGIESNRLNYMPDPTLLYDFSDISRPPQDFFSRHCKLAGVAVSDERLKIAVTKQLIDKGYTVINLLGPSLNNQISSDSKWAFSQRIGVYSGLSFMITDRFHGSILTLKQGSHPVVLVEPDYFYPKENSKGRDLFERLGLADMVWRFKKSADIPGNLIESFHEQSLKIDWTDKSNFKRLADEAIKHRIPEIMEALKA